MTDLLSAVLTVRAKSQDDDKQASKARNVPSHIQSGEDAATLLKSQPSFEELKIVVQYIHTPGFLLPSAKTSQILTPLINEVVPNYWEQIQDDASLRKKLVASLKGVSAIGAILTRLTALTSTVGDQPAAGQKSFLEAQILSLISVLDGILSSEGLALFVSKTFRNSDANSVQKTLYWKNFVQMVATGKVVTTVARAEEFVKKLGDYNPQSWLGDGKRFARWLARNVASLALDREEIGNAALLLGRSLTLGYSEPIVNEYMHYTISHTNDATKPLQSIMAHLKPFEQRKVLVELIHLVDRKLGAYGSGLEQRAVSAAAHFIRTITVNNEPLTEWVVDFLTRPESNPFIPSLGTIRACLIALAQDKLSIETVLEKTFERFSDETSTKHAPIMHQEQIAQTLLLVSGIVNRQNTHRLVTAAKTSTYINGISKHLASNSLRVRWLGMIIGTAVSKMVDKGEQLLKFDDDSLETDEAKAWLLLPKTDDKCSSGSSLESIFGSEQAIVSSAKTTLPIGRPKRATKPESKKKNLAPTKGPKIIEIMSDEEDLVPYAKPDSDPEDDDEDPTLVSRDKPKPPVYIRDLLVGLGETEDYDKFQIALSTAARLIRQKSGFGNEVKDNAEGLGRGLMNLNDSFEMDGFQEMRQEALIATLVADPARIGQLLARNVFEGDFSLQQRSAILATLGLGARELAGYKDTERDTADFPTKRLPDHLHAIYAEQQQQQQQQQQPLLNRVSARLQDAIIQPLALSAADAATGPNALKVRTFSSRMAKAKTRRAPVANALAKIVADNIFFPLTGRWWVHAHGKAAVAWTHLQPVFLRTLAVVMHAAGPFNLSLPQMTREFWTLLLSVRGGALEDRQYTVLEALLFAFLVLLETNENKERLAREHARELVETQEWTRLVMGAIDGRGGEEVDKVRGIAAAVVVRCGEVAEKWQRLMVGELV